MIKSHNIIPSAKAEILDRVTGDIYRTYTVNPVPIKESTIKATIKNPDGSIDKIIEFPFRSFVGNWFLFMRYGNSTGAYNFTNMAGGSTAKTVTYLTAHVNYGVDYAGIVVGSSNTALSFSDYNMDNFIDHGTSAGQLEYNRCYVYEPVVTGNNSYVDIRRAFTNTSGSSVTIREIGLAAATYGDGDGTTPLLTRDVEDQNGSPIELTVLDKQTIEIRYRFYNTTASDGGYTNPFMEALYYCLRPQASNIVTSTGGSKTRPFWSHEASTMFNCNGADTDTTRGIIAGSDNTAFTINDYSINTAIAHGTGAGQLYYWDTIIDDIVTDSNERYWEVKRAFSNDSSGSITLGEVALYGETASIWIWNLCIMRLVFNPAIILDPNECIRISLIQRASLV